MWPLGLSHETRHKIYKYLRKPVLALNKGTLHTSLKMDIGRGRIKTHGRIFSQGIFPSKTWGSNLSSLFVTHLLNPDISPLFYILHFYSHLDNPLLPSMLESNTLGSVRPSPHFGLSTTRICMTDLGITAMSTRQTPKDKVGGSISDVDAD